MTDYIPLGFTLNDANWTFNNDATATTGGTATFHYTGPAVAPSGTVQIPITLTAVNPVAGDMVNWAEISDDDGEDVDSTTDTNQGNDNQPANPGDPTDGVIDNTSGDEDDHDLAGIQLVAPPLYDLALTKVYTSDNSIDGLANDEQVQQGDDVTFTIEITNQGDVSATNFEITDYIPLGFALNDANWTFNNDATATSGGTATYNHAGPAIAPTGTTQVAITLAAVNPSAGTNVNRAEISGDDGFDFDSTPDALPDNDNQPVAPGDPTDGVIDGSAGDEDDHDIAGVIVNAYDLALTKVYTSDTFGNTTDGTIAPGANVTYTIEVTNQGSATATTFVLTDALPLGFTLNDSNWTFNNDATATSGGTATYTYTGTPLAPTTAVQIPITLTAVDPLAGNMINVAEISSDDGADIDSTPDNQNGTEDDRDSAPVAVYDLALTKVTTSDTFGNTTDGFIAPRSDVTYTIEITNQGSRDATTFELTDYIPLGFALNDANWTFNNDATSTSGGTATFSYSGPTVNPAGTTQIPITLTAVDPLAGDLVNWAEISADDGDDYDSTTDTTRGNDNQPANPGDPTDGVIDNTSGDEDDHDLAGVAIYDLALTKVYTSDTFGNTTDGSIAPGADVTYTIQVTNQGSAIATTFELTDSIPLGFTLNDANWTFNNDATATSGGTATLNYTGTPLASSANVQVSITLTATNPLAGNMINVAEITGDDGADIDSTPDNQNGTEDDRDTAPVTLYDLALTKVYTSDTFGGTSDGIIDAGADVTYTIEVTNQGTLDAKTFELTDYIPLGFTLNDANWTFNNDATATSGGTATFNYSGVTLAPSATTQIAITLNAVNPAAGDMVNWAEISADDGDDIDSTTDTTQGNDNQPAAPGDPTDGIIDNTSEDEDDHDPAAVQLVAVQPYDLALTKVYTSDNSVDGLANDGRVQQGDDVTFTIEITNQGSLDATNFQITDYLPLGFTLNDANWTFNNDATATSGGTATFTYSGPAVTPTGTTQIPITLTAVNPSAGTNANRAEISTDDGLDIDSTPDAMPDNDNQPAAPGDATDGATDNAAGDEDDHDIAGVVVDAYDLALTKVYTSDTFGNTNDGSIAPGADVTYTIQVTNQGTATASTFELTDSLPLGFTLNDANWTFNNDATATSGGTATFNYTGTPLAPTGNVQIPITLTATNPLAGNMINVAEITGDDGADIDSTPDNQNGTEDDRDSAPVTLYDLALTKVYTSDTFGVTNDGIIDAGANVTYTIEVTNQGTADAATFELTDYIPLGFTLNDANWTFNNDATVTSGGTATFNYAGPTLAPAATTQVTITLTATNPAAGDMVNWAEISADDGDDIDSTTDTTQGNDNQPAAPGDPTDGIIDNTSGDEDDHDPAAVQLVAVQPYDLALTKVYTSDNSVDGVANDGRVQQGDDVTFTIEITNQGSLDATNFQITDYLPLGFTLNDANWTFNNDATATSGGTATFTYSGPAITPTGTTQIPITLTAVNPSAGTNANRAEISTDDGFDIDSIPDTMPDNDNQPAAPGDPTDGTTNNAAGDEDDHDIAGVIVDAYDLALTKVYTSDTFGNTTDGSIAPGADVIYTIEITNQGSATASTFELTDSLPLGFTLNDANWTFNNDATATSGGTATSTTRAHLSPPPATYRFRSR